MRRGFVLLIVIMILGLMAAEFFVMTAGSNKIGFQTNRAFLDAVRQNLVSSGIAWAKYNIENGNIKETGKEFQLDIADTGIQNVRLAVKIEKIAREQVEVVMDTSCGFGGQSVKTNKKYVILR